MGQITRLYNFTPGQVMYAAQFNAEFNQILNVVNGNIETINISDDAVQAEKILGLTGTGSVSLENIPNGSTKKAVDSAATGDDIAFAATTVKRSYWIGAAMNSSTWNAGSQLAVTNYYAYPPNADGGYDYGWIPLNVPHGAKLRKIKIYGVTAVGGEIGVQIEKRDNSNIPVTMIADAYANNGASSGEDTCNETVDNDTYSYYLIVYAKIDGGGTVPDDAKLYRAYYEYTFTDVTQI